MGINPMGIKPNFRKHHWKEAGDGPSLVDFFYISPLCSTVESAKQRIDFLSQHLGQEQEGHGPLLALPRGITGGSPRRTSQRDQSNMQEYHCRNM